MLRGVTNRPGSNAEFQVVDEHNPARKPTTMDFTQSAGLPLTTITVWECLFDHLGLTPNSPGTLVAVAAAGGVGSMVTQLAGTQTGLTVFATASSPESARFAAALGAHHGVALAATHYHRPQPDADSPVADGSSNAD